MINNPGEDVVLPADLQAKIDAARNNLVILEETIKLKIAAKQAEEYTISQLIVQNEYLEATIATNNYKIKNLEDEISKNEDKLASVTIDVTNATNDLQALKDNADIINSLLETREAECLSRELAVKQRENDVNKLDAVINEYRA